MRAPVATWTMPKAAATVPNHALKAIGVDVLVYLELILGSTSE